MTHYQDMEVIPDEMSGKTVMMNLLFNRLHKALATLGDGSIGISFPKMDKTPGHILRLHGTKDALLRLERLSWPGPMKASIVVGGINDVPKEVQGYRTINRKQFKSNPERLRRRLAKRHNLSMEEAVKRIPDTYEQTSDLPFLQARSSSTGQRFRLFIEAGPLLDKPREGKFSAYGLSATATVPQF
ncbi:MAG: type I-F CRISPR-associated endoribonuclease Cas6/Csy4 [Desulfovibrio sp.]|nr:type I-F CRISPR-associated endoribonuclease Cas6/Csy4 [Desulfovibrio sp.]